MTSFSAFERLPIDVASKILDGLSLRSIASLSATSRGCLLLCRSNTLWRTVCRTLVSNWLHSPSLASSSIGSSSSPDWTLTFDAWPIALPPPSPCNHAPRPNQPIHTSNQRQEDWFQLATRFLLPNFRHLGWHASSRYSLGRLLLVTFNPLKCELVGEEIQAINLFDMSYYAGQASSPYLAVLPLTRPAHPPLEHPLSAHMDSYRIPFNVESPHAGYDVDLFKPAYVSIPHFRLRPASSSDALAIKIVSQQLHSAPSYSRVFPSLDTLKAFRPPHLTLDTPLLTSHLSPHFPHYSPGSDLPTTFTVALPPLGPLYVAPSLPNIRWQTQLAPPSAHSVTVIQHGRKHHLQTGAQKGIEEVFLPVQGPALSGLQGLWVGYYGHHHGAEFGHLVLSDKELVFIKVTGDRNVPSGVVSWKVSLNDPGTIDETGHNKTIRGQGRIANEDYWNPAWIVIWVTFIGWNARQESSSIGRGYDSGWDGSGVNWIQVAWTELNHVSSFYRVQLTL